MTVLIRDIFSNFDDVPCFAKYDVMLVFGRGLSKSLNQRLWRALKDDRILQLKNGFYMTNLFYFQEPDKVKLAECIASRIRFPSYLSLEYALQKYGLLIGNFPVTSVTSKTGCSYDNFLGSFVYSNVKELLYSGFEEVVFHKHKYFIATKAKALFDYLYLKPGLGRTRRDLKRRLFHELGIRWENFSREDFDVFDGFVWKSNSAKMMKILDILDEYFSGKDFRKWVGEMLK